MRSKEALRLRIMELCSEKEMTVNAFSKCCGVRQSTLSNVVNGRNNSMTISTVEKICNGLGISVAAFFDSELFRGLEQEVV